MFLINWPLSWLFGNRICQLILDRIVKWLNHFRGIGSGTGVASSGERVVFNVMKKHGSSPYCVFDVGANKGQFLQLTLDNIGREPHDIHCFEPGKQTFEILTRSQPPSEHIRLNNAGLAKEVGEAELHYDEVGSGLASLTKRDMVHRGIDFSQRETVTLDTVDHYCEVNQIERIDLLKIDVEGHELDVLTGAKRMFDEKRIGTVIFEFGGTSVDTRIYFRDFWNFFQDIGFSLFRITPSGYLFQIKKYRERDEQFLTANFVAISLEN